MSKPSFDKMSVEEVLSLLSQAPVLAEVTPYGLAPWSASKLKMLERCPLQFYLAYIVKWKLRVEEDPDDVLRRNVGTTAHYILEKLIGGYTLADSIKLAEHRYKNVVTPERWHHVEALYPSIHSFNRRLFELEERVDITCVDTELQVAVDKDFNRVPDFFSKDAFLRGVIDLSMRTDTNDGITIDHKYGGTAAWGLNNYRTQLNIYKILEHFSNSAVRGIQTGIHFMENREVSLEKYVSSHMIEVGLTKWLVDKIGRVVLRVLEDGIFRHCRGAHCVYCPYEEFCKAGPRGTAGKLEPIKLKTQLIFS